MAQRVDVHSNRAGVLGGIFGHLSSSGNVSLSAHAGPIDVHIESIHALVHHSQTVLLSTHDS